MPVQVGDGKKPVIAVNREQADALIAVYELDRNALLAEQYKAKVKTIPNSAREEPREQQALIKVARDLHPRTHNHFLISRALSRSLKVKEGITEIRIESIKLKSKRVNLDTIRSLLF